MYRAAKDHRKASELIPSRPRPSLRLNGGASVGSGEFVQVQILITRYRHCSVYVRGLTRVAALWAIAPNNATYLPGLRNVVPVRTGESAGKAQRTASRFWRPSAEANAGRCGFATWGNACCRSAAVLDISNGRRHECGFCGRPRCPGKCQLHLQPVVPSYHDSSHRARKLWPN